jgi:hypothetical protein
VVYIEGGKKRSALVNTGDNEIIAAKNSKVAKKRG